VAVPGRWHLISKLTGDVLMYIGENGITVLKDGNFVVKSPQFQFPSDPAAVIEEPPRGSTRPRGYRGR
jgi:hypothetical protein